MNNALRAKAQAEAKATITASPCRICGDAMTDLHTECWVAFKPVSA